MEGCLARQSHLMTSVLDLCSFLSLHFLKQFHLQKIRPTPYFIFLALHIQFCCSSRPHHHQLKNHSINTMGNCINATSSLQNLSTKTIQPLPIETMFKLPSPLPSWPQGVGFASGTIDLGGLQVCQVSTLNKIWSIQEGGPDNLGATFFEPSSIPNGFFTLGFYSQPNNIPLYGWVLAAKDSSDQGILKKPTDYTLVWSSESLNIKQDGVGYIWQPIPPDGYKAIGHVVTSSPQKPELEKIRCVHENFTDVSDIDGWIWGGSSGINIYSSRPKDRGLQYLGVSTGTFIALQNNSPATSLAGLKNVQGNFHVMPNLNQIEALVQEYSPVIYFHPDEEFFPSSVNWFFQNGALLYTKGQESNPVGITPTGSNLPQGGSNDGAYWIDLPSDDSEKDRVKKGNLQNASVYIHVKPMLGATFTDLAMWVFYPFNGAARAKVEFFTIKLGKIGEHVGDWEHVTLRISNFNGELQGVYFSQHSKGTWVSSSQLEFQNGNKPVVYSSLHGHAAYPRTGDFLQGNTKNIGIRNDTGKGKFFMDVGANFSVVSADYLRSTIVEPPWLNFAREWGPKISYDIDDEIKKVDKFLPGKLRTAFEKAIRGIPNEVLGEEGPTGPKWKDNWSGDERT
ncbi:hypothetical protein ACH5RR_000636 [Cinchona calisaya]|uniref:Vacuolar protein sorting-associated protein 62 n=1 Tax=Cinchona calisaya TaxID=153742 RepID=A0ABD3B167_9GENT